MRDGHVHLHIHVVVERGGAGGGGWGGHGEGGGKRERGAGEVVDGGRGWLHFEVAALALEAGLEAGGAGR